MPASRPARRVPCATHPAGAARKKYLQGSKRVLAGALLLRCFLAAQDTLEFCYRYTLLQALELQLHYFASTCTQLADGPVLRVLRCRAYILPHMRCRA